MALQYQAHQDRSSEAWLPTCWCFEMSKTATHHGLSHGRLGRGAWMLGYGGLGVRVLPGWLVGGPSPH